MTARSRIVMSLGRALVAAALINCSTDTDDPPPPIDGFPAWQGSQSLSDPGQQLSCTDLTTIVVLQDGGSFTGSMTLDGICDTPGGLIDNSGTLAIEEGRITGTKGPTSNITFVIPGAPGQPDCEYRGELTVAQAQGTGSASGSISCVGAGYNANGTWDMAR